MPTFAVEPLTEATARVLGAAGAPDDIAGKLARWLINANLSGHPSHGVIRVHSVPGADQGRVPTGRRSVPRVVSESDTSVVMEGGGAFGHLAAEELTIRLVEKSRVSRVAVGGIAKLQPHWAAGRMVGVGRLDGRDLHDGCRRTRA